MTLIRQFFLLGLVYFEYILEEDFVWGDDSKAYTL